MVRLGLTTAGRALPRLFGVGAVLSAELLVEGATWDASGRAAINEFIPDR